MGQYRLQRLNDQLRDEISQLILRGEIRDPRVYVTKKGSGGREELPPFLSINRVEVTSDLSWGKVYVSSFGTDAMLKKGVDGLNSAAGFIQREIASKLRIRKFPKLIFIVDEGMKEGFRMVQKLNQLEAESKNLEAEKNKDGE